MTRHVPKVLRRIAAPLAVVSFLAAAITAFPGVAASHAPDWSTPANLGANVNSAFGEFAPCPSPDGLSLYFTSTRPGSQGGEDLWVSRRASRNDPWEIPQNLGAAVNTEFNERSAALSANARLLFFATDRPGGSGGFDVWVSWRPDPTDDLGWQPPVNAGTGINTASTDAGPSFVEPVRRSHGHGRPVSRIPQLFIGTNRPGGAGGLDIYVGSMPGGWSGPPVLVAELSSPQADLTPSVSRSGLEVVFASDRPGTVGGQDLWMASRRSLERAWSTPQNLGPVVNSTSVDNFPALSADRRSLYFGSTRAGGFGGQDLYVTTRW
jgi:Tol biopolymer transport system component